MTDNRMRDRVKGLLGTPLPDDDKAPEHIDGHSDPDAERQALQVLTLAQRTAEEHVASAHRQAERIHAEARATAEEIVRDAQQHAHGVRREADTSLADARAAAQRTAREAQERADDARRAAEKMLAEARERADAAAADAQAKADELARRAQQRYDDVVGSLAAKREALQRQIEALEQFDRDYRARLTAFMQGQLRALWVDEPRVDGDVDEADAASAAEPIAPPSPLHRRSRPA